MSARRYIVVVQAAEGYPAKRPYNGPIPTPPEPVVHSAVLADDYERVEAEVAGLRAAFAVVEAAQLRGEVPASVIRDMRAALRAPGSAA